ncbi:MAG: adenylyl-sulfate kinase, partial [Thermosynechococcaceae cyanobacterium]
CQASLEVCEERDVKGLYKRARSGEIAHFTGISSPYEAPEQPEIAVETGSKSLEDCAQQVIDYLTEKGVLK